MLRLLSIILVCAGFAWPAEAKQLRTTGDELLCRRSQDLMFYLAVRTAKEFKDREVAGCMALRRGLRYTLLEGDESGLTRIRVQLGSRRSIEGYAINVGE
jgi:hypothetical protein